MAKSDLSPTMRDALDKLRTHGNLMRFPGGFWTYGGCAVHPPPRDNVPTWWVEVRTVRALVDRGVARWHEVEKVAVPHGEA